MRRAPAPASPGESFAARRRRIAGLIRKESRQIIRDPSSILIAVVLPLILLFLFGYGVSLDPQRIRLGVVVERPTEQTDALLASFQNARAFDVRVSTDRARVQEALAAGRLQGVVVVPADFSARAGREETAPVQVIVNGGDPNTAGLVLNYVQGAWTNWLAQRAAPLGRPLAAPVSAAARTWFNPSRESRNSLLPGSIAIILTIIGTLLTSLVIAREWERGTMEALLATPASPREVVVGKYVPYFVLGMTAAGLCICVTVFVFGVPLRGSIWALAGVTAAFLTTGLGFGLLISTVTRNQFLSSQIALVAAFLPAFALSGFVFEPNSMPGWIQVISHVIPARYYVDAVRTLFLAGDGAVVARDAAVLTFMGLVLTAATLARTKSRIDG